ncbi:MAG TPA: GNAT family N-acetyltransferase [Blastocatellia bacterium]|nr:GNAT family N-acetyltransferase [Blastocatellia bacterium]
MKREKKAIAISQPADRRPRAVVRREVRELEEADHARVLEYLATDPLQGVHLQSQIEDYGIRSPKHRGLLCGCFEDGQLAGVALLGHAILLFTGPENEEAVLRGFARAAAEMRAKGHVIFGPRRQVEIFWTQLARFGRETRLVHNHLWYVCEEPRLPLERLQMQKAGPEEIDVVAEAQAEMVREESGIDPRIADPEGYRRRAAERIERGRTWVKIEDGRVVFKAELQSITPEAIYLEGIWTHPEYRQRGIAKSCVAELTHRRLNQQQVICLVVEPDKLVARRVYEQVGFSRCGEYQARYLKPLAED